MAHEMFLAEDFFGKAKNIYEATMMVTLRARYIAEQQRREMDDYLGQIEMNDKFNEDDEGMIEDTPVPHEPMIQFEKPTILALREMIAGKLVDRRKKAEAEEDTSAETDEGISFPGKLTLDLSEDDETSDHEL